MDARPHLFKVVDDETAKTVAYFDSEHEAEQGLRRLCQEYPARAEFLVLVVMDDKGEPLGSREVSDLPSAV